MAHSLAFGLLYEGGHSESIITHGARKPIEDTLEHNDAQMLMMEPFSLRIYEKERLPKTMCIAMMNERADTLTIKTITTSTYRIRHEERTKSKTNQY